MENAITMSDNYRSGFMIRVKKTNGKTNSVWLELSSHNEKLATTVEELQKLVKDMSLEEDVRFGEGIGEVHGSKAEVEPNEAERMTRKTRLKGINGSQ